MITSLLNPAIGRLGTETAFSITARAMAIKATGKPVVNFSIGQPDHKTAPHIVDAAVKALRDGHHGYTPSQGLPLREAVAAYYHRQYGATVSPDDVLITPGGKMIMFMAITMFGGPGTEIIYPDPSYPIYRSLINYIGSRAVDLPLLEKNGFSFSAEDVLARCNDKTRLIIINTPANPTGGVLPKAEMDKLVAGLAKFPKAMILADEIYSRLIYDGATHVSFLQYPDIRDRLIVLDGASKTYAMTGWRLGFSIWPREVMPDAVRVATNSFSCVSSASQFAGIAALNGDQAPAEAMRQDLDERRKKILGLINTIPYFSAGTPKGSFFVFVNVRQLLDKHGGDSQSWHKRLLEEAGIATVPGSAFGIHGEGYLRFCYCCSNQDIDDGMAMVKAFMEKVG